MKEQLEVARRLIKNDKVFVGFDQLAGTDGTDISHFNNQVIVDSIDGIPEIIGSDFDDTFHVFKADVTSTIVLDGGAYHDLDGGFAHEVLIGCVDNDPESFQMEVLFVLAHGLFHQKQLPTRSPVRSL